MKKPMTTAEFFDKICEILKEKNMMPDILDYNLADTYDQRSMKTINFDVTNNLNYGYSEGIYLDIYAVFYDERDEYGRGRPETTRLGTFKTLHRDREAMYVMARLLADFVSEAVGYVNDHMDDFTWTGYDVDGYKENGSFGVGYTCMTQNSVEKRKKELLERYPKVVVRNNETRKETVYLEEENHD